MEDKIKLVSCPFCGGEPEFDRYVRGTNKYVCVTCSECGAESAEVKVSHDVCADEEAAIAWNRRICRCGHIWDKIKKGISKTQKRNTIDDDVVAFMRNYGAHGISDFGPYKNEKLDAEDGVILWMDNGDVVIFFNKAEGEDDRVCSKAGNAHEEGAGRDNKEAQE
jgi:hypothetical protein